MEKEEKCSEQETKVSLAKFGTFNALICPL